jgi:hypothetical protein
MKKFFAMLALTLTFAAVAGSASPKKDLPVPECFPCLPGSTRS